MSANVANRPRRSVRPAGGPQRLGRALLWPAVTLLALALLLSVSGAFRTADWALGHRILLWLVVCGLIAGQFLLAAASFLARVPRAAVARTAAWIAAFFVSWMLSTVEIAALKHTPLLPKQPDPFAAFALFLLPTVALVCLAAYAVWRAATLPPAAARRPAGAKPEPAEDADGWPREPILWVESQDHYLRLQTASRSLLVRGRLADALARLKAAEGIRVHRSWWVARDAVASAERRGRDYRLVLKDRTRVPVSRSRVAALRDAGWL